MTDSGPSSLNGSYGAAVSEGVSALTQGAGGAAGFPGGTAYNAAGFASTAQATQLQPATPTVEAWIKFTTAIPANTYVPIAVYGSNGTSYGLYLQGKANNVVTLFYQQTNAGASGRLLLHGAKTLTLGTVYHIVATFNGSSVATYVNGVPDVSTNYAGTVSYPSSAPVGLQIGGQLSSTGSGDASFPGTIAQVAVYGSALSSATVVNHYLAGQLVQTTSETAVPADSFVDSIGVNTHFGASAELYVSAFPQVKSLLAASGIRHIRDGLQTGPQFVSAMQALAAAGNIHGDFITLPTTVASDVTSYPALISPMLESFEAPNEQDVYEGGLPNWPQTCATFQANLYNWVKSSPSTASYPVIGPSMAMASDYSQIPGLSAVLDYGNVHDYMGNYNPGFLGGPFGGIQAMLADATATSGTKPIIATESGYGTIGGGGSGLIDNSTYLRYIPRLFFEEFKDGVTRTYGYELLDSVHANTSFSTYGLVTTALTPKPAFTALTGIIAQLADPGQPFVAGSLNYNLSGLSTVHHLLMQKHNGQFVLAIWQEVPGWNVSAGGDISVANQNITLTTAKAFSSASIASLDESGNLSSAPLTWTNQQITFPVSDKVSLITLTP